ncbi:MAG: Na+/H+ antiporter NhaC family protein [Bacteroidaceae bacterium]
MTESKPLTRKPSLWALSPLLVFFVFYLSASVVAGDFYRMPITVAFLAASIYAVAYVRGMSLNDRIFHFSRGASNKNILFMVWIFVLAGAFAQSAKAMGAIDATVGLALSVVPDGWLYAGIFVAACFVSLAVGTSVGTIVALSPVAIGIAERTGATVPFVVAIVVGGAFFGDNLSFISDTTIAATRTQGCAMRDKFRVNSLIAIPAAAAVLAIYIVQGLSAPASAEVPEVEWLKVLPYLVVLGSAIAGVHVCVVLLAGILATGFIGCITDSFDPFGWFAAMNEGIVGMGELVLITLMAGGMLEMIRLQGGIAWLIEKLTHHADSKRAAEFSIAALVGMADLCTANNTIAVITIGPIARDIAERFDLDRRKTASILDTCSCFVQGIIPYGAQMLMAAGLASISPLSILRHLYYPPVLGLFALLAIAFRYPRRYS